MKSAAGRADVFSGPTDQMHCVSSACVYVHAISLILYRKPPLVPTSTCDNPIREDKWKV